MKAITTTIMATICRQLQSFRNVHLIYLCLFSHQPHEVGIIIYYSHLTDEKIASQEGRPHMALSLLGTE